ncbi:hypothetical protein MNBD_CHLOROFLEXI01-1138 [hydrothermal vent metagenome]|uniref:Uncharacterized protein n=1 Tax=hydrothermal vent metagenome TaxID=652676 RepID=A0A3B0VNH8_9ZZZZ
MNREEILALYDEQERKNNSQPSHIREVAGKVVRHVSKEPAQLSFVTYSDLTAVVAHPRPRSNSARLPLSHGRCQPNEPPHSGKARLSIADADDTVHLEK